MKSIVNIGDPVRVKFFHKKDNNSPATANWRDATVAYIKENYQIGVVFADGTRQMLPWDSDSWSVNK